MQCPSYHNFLHKKIPYLHALQGNGEMGARYLDPKYSRWISTDPALGEYMSGSDAGCGGVYNSVNLSLYHYVGNNPIKYTDPDGRELYIDGDEQYQAGVLLWLQKLTDDKVSIDEDGKVSVSERTGFFGFLYKLFHKSKPTGTELLRGLCNEDSNNCIISEDATYARSSLPGEFYFKRDANDPERIKNASNGVGVDCAISFDPYLNYSYFSIFDVENDKGDKIKSTNQTILAHELIHGYYDIRGETTATPEEQVIGLGAFSGNKITKNKIRQEQEGRKNRNRGKW